jgi:hypothetical protein
MEDWDETGVSSSRLCIRITWLAYKNFQTLIQILTSGDEACLLLHLISSPKESSRTRLQLAPTPSDFQLHETPALESWFCNLFSKWLWKGHLGPLSLSTLAYKMGIATLMETWQDCYRDKWENVGERSCKILHFIQINFWFWKKDTSFNHTHSAAKKLKQRSQKYTVRVSLTLDMRDYLLAWNF